MLDVLRSPPLHFCTSGRSNCGSVDLRSVSSCNDYKQRGFDTKSFKNSNFVVPLTDSHSTAFSSQQKNCGGRVMSWLFPKLKRKQNTNLIFSSPNRSERSEEVSATLKDSGSCVEKTKRELMEAKRSREAALTQVSEVKSSLGELSEKLQDLESYCDSLLKALREATTKIVSKENSSGKKKSEIPVGEDVMIELKRVLEDCIGIKIIDKVILENISFRDRRRRLNFN